MTNAIRECNIDYNVITENKLDYKNDICSGVENGGEITMEHEPKLIDVS